MHTPNIIPDTRNVLATATAAYIAGQEAFNNGSSRAAAMCPVVMDWLAEHQPDVGDVDARRILDAFVDGYRESENEATAKFFANLT